MRMKEQVAEIVGAYLRRHQVAADQLPTLISTVYGALSGIENAPPEPAPNLTPAVPIRRSIGDDAITCLDCGKKAKMIKRHLATAHAMTPDQYRARWGLPNDYPLVAKNYAMRRSELARSIGLGVKGRARRTDS
jgi:predicted transcriptional regulator